MLEIYCEKCKDRKRFTYKRTPDGTTYVCSKCEYIIKDLAKYEYARERSFMSSSRADI